MVENGRKKVHRDYLVGNGFSRVSRHSPTTNRITNYQSNFHFRINITHLKKHVGTKRTKGLLLSQFYIYYPSACITFQSIPTMEENIDPSR